MSGRRRGRGALLATVAGLAALLAPMASPASAAPAHVPAHTSAAAKVPRTVVLDGEQLRQTKGRLAKGDPALRRAVADLRTQADGWLGQGPWTVTDKDRTPPGGDKHDYLSQAPYWWASQPKTADNPMGCPYLQKDGQRNPEVDELTDHDERGEVFASAYTLSLAWYYTGDPAYSRHAAEILRTWFTDPATRMNPNLDHAQIIPCKYDGRAIGIIDFSQGFTSVLDATAILDTGAPGWTKGDRGGMRTWYEGFRNWLGGAFGKEEAAAANNHGTFFDMQLAALQLATGHDGLARQTVLKARAGRIDPQIAADGSQPGEISRTRSWHYSTFNLVAFTRLAAIGRHVGVNLWSYRGPAGQRLSAAVDYLLPAATGKVPWPHPELDFRAYAASDIVHAAADAGDPKARAAVPALQAPPGGDLWALRPAAEQLDSITG
ncbi:MULTISPECIES: alginate lyase family protein [Streptomyces]|uniref:alginate lyase family protein n=1 Tax=Streptomyces TaxID=1883 RepID=UPI0018DFA822|nr:MULTISPECIES: alginate lyase family protein [Streptomyces]MCZ4100560.1 alginate lyase family protein [Streptomyces sp. H39-C1]